MPPNAARDKEIDLGPTVMVDGVLRPALNSHNQPIHPTEEGIVNFWRWFGDSKAVDPKTGRPLVLMHGTASDFDAFDPAKSDSKAKTGAPESTFFFTDAPDVASSYTVKWQGDFSSDLHPGANVIPVYLKIDRPLKANARGNNWRDIPHKGDWVDSNDIAALAKTSRRYDGAIIRNVRDKGVGTTTSPVATTFIVTSPLQIKSALGNSGAFNPTSPHFCDHEESAALHRAARHTILVDGIERPTVNSANRPIHATEDGIRNFWRWFAGSHAVTPEGKPLVLYHGSRSHGEFTAFDGAHGNPCSGGGHYFSDDKQLAAKFGEVQEFYLNIRNPVFDGFSGSGAVMAPSGYRDGGIFTKTNTDGYAAKGTKEYIVFDPRQIKSATHNSGAFDPSSVHFCDSVENPAPSPQAAAPATILVDGTERPTTNSANQPIHPTEDGIRNFWRWFGNGATDDRGLPLVLFHGTQSDVAYFDGQRQGETVSKNDIGFFFTNYAREASLYAVGDWWRDDPAPNVMPVYLGFQNPKVLTPDDYESPALWYDDHGRKASLEALAGGHDGLVIRSTRETMVMEDGQQITMFVAFNATDIKSAIGNSGAFVRNSPMISDSEPLQAKPTVSRGMASRLLTLDEALSPEASGPASALLQGPR